MEEFFEWLEALRSSEKLILVEGKKDRKSLEQFGINNIITLGPPLYEVCEYVASQTKDVIILTDLDKKGKELYGKLNSQLSQMGVRVDNRFREFLFLKKLSHIEGLVSFISRM